jgi:hypothetical protein
MIRLYIVVGLLAGKKNKSRKISLPFTDINKYMLDKWFDHFILSFRAIQTSIQQYKKKFNFILNQLEFLE